VTEYRSVVVTIFWSDWIPLFTKWRAGIPIRRCRESRAEHLAGNSWSN